MTDQPAERPMTFEEKIEKSSQVCFADYDPGARELRIVFRTNAALYVYFDYPANMWDQLRAAPSVGSFLIHNVTRPKNGELPYRYEKRKLPEGFVMPVLVNTRSSKTKTDAKAPSGDIGF